MKIGVIGIGGIAEKAYLPTYAKLQGSFDFVFATRNPATQEKISQQYGFDQWVNTIDELLLAEIDACMIHAATEVHFALAKKCLSQSIPVLMDKPISEDLAEVTELQTLAQANNTLLMVGFNRRFAPMVSQLKEITDKRTIQLQKNEVYHPLAIQYGLYDLFIHLVDTAVYLLDDAILMSHGKIREEAGLMTYVQLQLSTATTECFLSMDLISGAKFERYQVTSPSKTTVVDQLTQKNIYQQTTQKSETFGDWTPTLEKRGFEQMVLAFCGYLKGEETDLKQENILISHQLCHDLLQHHLQRIL